MGRRDGFSAGSATLAPGTPVVVGLSTAVFDPLAKRFPPVALLDRIEVNFSALVASNLLAEAFLTYDAAGDLFASNLQSQAIERGQTTTTDGGAIFSVGGTFVPRAGTDPGTLYLWLDVSGVGTPFAECRGIWNDGGTN